jgi:8-amino-7-oxononanoate synthase
LLIGADQQAMALSQQLREQGFLITAIRPPTVPDGQARLRVTLSAAHEESDVDALLAALEKVGGRTSDVRR